MAEQFAPAEQVLHVSQLSEQGTEEEWNKWIATRSLQVKVGPDDWHVRCC
jgi:hypothetical protein